MMPDRDKTRPWLVSQVERAEQDVAIARRMAAALGGGASLGVALALNKPMGELAVARTLLALADAEWEREAAKTMENVRVRCESLTGSTEDAVGQARDAAHAAVVAFRKS